MSEKTLESIDKKMTMMLKLLALNIIVGKKVNEQMVLLHNVGMTPAEIAKILNKTSHNVSATLHKARKSKKEVSKDSTVDDAQEE